MFTLEESAHLGFMLRFLGWMAAAVIVGGGCYECIHWMHAHHRLPAIHAFHQIHHV
jgi:hypothetical protein